MVLWTSAVQAHGNRVNPPYLGAFVAFGMYVVSYYIVAIPNGSRDSLGCCTRPSQSCEIADEPSSTMVCACGIGFHVYCYMVPRSAQVLHRRLLATVMSAPLYFFTSTHAGQILNRFGNDLSMIDNELPLAMMQVFGPLCLVIVQLVFLCLSAAYFVAILPGVFVVLYFLQRYYLRTSRQLRLLDLEAKAPLFSHFMETLSGLITIRAFNWQEAFRERHVELMDKSQKPYYLMFCVQRWLSLVLGLVSIVPDGYSFH